MSPGDWAADWMGHADEEQGIEHETMLAHLRRAMFDVRDAESRVGRYRDLQVIGRGGMGVVFRARDDTVGRDVVLKLVRHDSPDHGQWLRREAQAMAQLSHPNVVQVLEVGEHHGETFIVMELVEGRDGGQWLAERPRPWRAVLEVFLGAGEGLAAAHAVQLVHRDFKPRNIMVGDDGRVRVTDFGLAGYEATRSSEPSAALVDAERGGTPRYMAPEQRDGARVDHRADQWSFAASLWEALYGHHPFADDDGTVDPSRASLTPGHRPPIPRRLRRVLAKALARSPSDRYESMPGLLDALRGAASARPGRRAGLALGVTAVGLVGVLVWRSSPPRGMPPCEPTEHSQRVWSATSRASIERAFMSTGAPYAERAWTRVDERVGRWIASWNDAYRATCETMNDAAEPDPTSDLRLSCLRAGLTEVGGVLETFARADEDVLVHAEVATRDLPSHARCSSLRSDPSTDAAARMAHDERMAMVRSVARQGHYDEAVRLAAEAAEAAHDPALRAEADLDRGLNLTASGDLAGGLEALQAAYYTTAALMDASRSTHAAVGRLYVAVRRGETQDAERWIRHVTTWIGRMEEGEDRVAFERQLAIATAELRFDQRRYEDALAQLDRAWDLCEGDDTMPIVPRIFNQMGLVHLERGAYERAERWLRRSYELRRALAGDGHPSLASMAGNLGNVYLYQDDYEEAQAAYLEALEILRATVGDSHPSTAMTWMNLGLVADAQGEPERAVTHFEQALASMKSAVGRDHPRTALILNNLGATLMTMGRWEQGAQYSREALEILELHLSPESPRVVDALHNLALGLGEQGHHADAVELLERELAIITKAEGYVFAQPPSIMLDMAQYLRRAGDLERAEALDREALALYQQVPSPEPADLARARVGLAADALASARVEEAVEHARRARELGPGDPLTRGLAAFSLAAGLWRTGRDHARVAPLLDEARRDLRSAGPAAAYDLAALERWVVNEGL